MSLEFEEEDEGGDGAAWMATFSDLCTLLLTFFVLLLSFANLDIVKFRVALGSVKDALGVPLETPGDFEALATSPIELAKVQSSSQLQVVEEMKLLEQVKDIIKEKGLEDTISAELGQRGVIVRVKGHVLFDLGSDTLRDEGRTALDAISLVSEKLPFPLIVEGHTDDLPISTSRFPSNWELSTARAGTAMRYLVSDGAVSPQRVGIAGYAHMRPLVDNDSDEGRAKNRRVEFIFLRAQSDVDGEMTPEAAARAADEVRRRREKRAQKAAAAAETPAGATGDATVKDDAPAKDAKDAPAPRTDD